MADTIIEVKNLSKSFDIPHEQTNTIKGNFVNPFKRRGIKEVFNAISDVSFDIKKGEVLGVLGRNGGGKSTLLKILAGIYTPTEGEVNVHGRVVPFLELGVGFNPELTGRENVFLNGTILGMTREYLEENFDSIVEFAEVGDFIDLQVKNYSSGMLVRLAFSIAVKADADVYLLDEILGVGDIAFQRKSLKLFNDLKKQGKTIVYVSHNVSSIENFCDKAILLEKSKLIAFGKASEVTSVYQKLMSPKDNLDNLSDAFEGNAHRWGNGKVIIDKFRITEDKQDKNSFNSQDKITFEINYTVKEAVENVAFGLSIYHENKDERVFGTHNYDPTNHVDLKPGNGTVKMTLEAKYFLSTDYLVTVAVFDMDSATPLDYHDKLYRFSVYNDSHDEGFVTLPVNWH